jgi:hypothetical protein
LSDEPLEFLGRTLERGNEIRRLGVIVGHGLHHLAHHLVGVGRARHARAELRPVPAGKFAHPGTRRGGIGFGPAQDVEHLHRAAGLELELPVVEGGSQPPLLARSRKQVAGEPGLVGFQCRDCDLGRFTHVAGRRRPTRRTVDDRPEEIDGSPGLRNGNLGLDLRRRLQVCARLLEEVWQGAHPRDRRPKPPFDRGVVALDEVVDRVRGEVRVEERIAPPRLQVGHAEVIEIELTEKDVAIHAVFEAQARWIQGTKFGGKALALAVAFRDGAGRHVADAAVVPVVAHRGRPLRVLCKPPRQVPVNQGLQPRPGIRRTRLLPRRQQRDDRHQQRHSHQSAPSDQWSSHRNLPWGAL